MKMGFSRPHGSRKTMYHGFIVYTAIIVTVVLILLLHGGNG